jgi:hypothetical protein
MKLQFYLADARGVTILGTATDLLIYYKYNFGVQFCSVKLMAYIAMPHDCVVGGLQHGCSL